MQSLISQSREAKLVSETLAADGWAELTRRRPASERAARSSRPCVSLASGRRSRLLGKLCYSSDASLHDRVLKCVKKPKRS